ncbi:hypothetical protein [Pseudarthrobacter sp. LMD1-1-1.1]
MHDLTRYLSQFMDTTDYSMRPRRYPVRAGPAQPHPTGQRR